MCNANGQHYCVSFFSVRHFSPVNAGGSVESRQQLTSELTSKERSGDDFLAASNAMHSSAAQCTSANGPCASWKPPLDMQNGVSVRCGGSRHLAANGYQTKQGCSKWQGEARRLTASWQLTHGRVSDPHIHIAEGVKLSTARIKCSRKKTKQ